MKVKVVVPVWGPDYINTYLNISLASQLSKNNIPLISKKYTIEYVIYTLKRDELYIANSEGYKLLKNFATVRFETIRKFKTKNVYRIYGQIHRKELIKSSKINESVFLINSDFVFSDGFFSKTLKEIESGKKAVNIFCPRSNFDSVSLILKNKFSESKNVIKVSSENLTKIFLNNVHNIMSYHMMPKNRGDDFLPSSLIWKSKKGSLLVRNFHFHPIVVHPYSYKIRKMKMTIDDGYILDMFELDKISFQKNTKDYFAIELSDESTTYSPIGKYGDTSALFFYFLIQNKSNFINYTQQVIVGDFTNAELAYFQTQSEKEISRIANLVLYESSRFIGKIRFYNLFQLYRLVSIEVVKIKSYIPSFIYASLRNVHRHIVREFFRVRNYF
jgi:hypothetical protein